ncbi:MAG: hypothetical protein SGPRY_003880, partial [Prymnesium sp.]
MGGTPKSWTKRKDKQGSRKSKSRDRSHIALEESDLNFKFHRQWGHWTNEHMIDELAKYYSVPSISLRNVIWHAMKANESFHGLALPEL